MLLLYFCEYLNMCLIVILKKKKKKKKSTKQNRNIYFLFVMSLQGVFRVWILGERFYTILCNLYTCQLNFLLVAAYGHNLHKSKVESCKFFIYTICFGNLSNVYKNFHNQFCVGVQSENPFPQQTSIRSSRGLLPRHFAFAFFRYFVDWFVDLIIGR